MWGAKYLVRIVELHSSDTKRVECISKPGDHELTFILPNSIAESFKKGMYVAVNVESTTATAEPEKPQANGK